MNLKIQCVSDARGHRLSYRAEPDFGFFPPPKRAASEDVGKASPQLGKQSALRTDSFSAPSPTITPALTTEDFFSPCSPLLPATQTPSLTRKDKKKKPASFQHALPPYLSVYRTLSARFLCQTPLLFSLFVCFTVIILLAQKRVGVLAALQKRDAERKRSYMGTELRLNIY